jgi:hypothetical protein
MLPWVGILLACAGVGAFIGSRSNPFPPGVRDPGAQPSESPVDPSPPPLVDWSFTMVSRTRHTFRVGGACTSDWRLRGRLELTASGRIRGRGVARILPGAGCDFPSAQLQARRSTIGVRGRRDGDDLVLRFREEGRMPVGSQDLGGFLRTLGAIRITIPERTGAEASTTRRVEEPEDEIFVSVTTVRLRD